MRLSAIFLVAVVLTCSSLAPSESALARDVPRVGISVEAEAGAVWQARNEVQIPADTGTRFSLTDFGTGPFFTSRFYLSYALSDRSELRALFAPLTLELEGEPGKAIVFQDETFAPGVATDATYTFNSYRLTYRYKLVDDSPWSLWIGFTGKIRDAAIRLAQGSVSAERTNVGFVPLLYFAAAYGFDAKWGASLDVDALAAPQGRAEDIGLFATFRPIEDVQLRLGYRVVEGGSEGGGDVYNFALLHYAVFGARVEW